MFGSDFENFKSLFIMYKSTLIIIIHIQFWLYVRKNIGYLLAIKSCWWQCQHFKEEYWAKINNLQIEHQRLIIQFAKLPPTLREQSLGKIILLIYDKQIQRAILICNYN